MKFNVGDLLLVDVCVGQQNGKPVYAAAYYLCTKRINDPTRTNSKIYWLIIQGRKSHPNIPNHLRLGFYGNHWKKNFTRGADSLSQIRPQTLNVVIRANVTNSKFQKRRTKKKKHP